MFNRPVYMSKLEGYRDKPLIKVITGMRRTGKSTLLALFKESLLASGVSSTHIIEMNFESLVWRDITGHESLYDYLKSQLKPHKQSYLLLDEIQMVPGWEKAIISCMVDFKVDIYLTGSNAYLLSSELSTLLAGRYVEINLYPLSFKEYFDFTNGTALDGENGAKLPRPPASIDQLFAQFLKYGAMPSVVDYLGNPSQVNEVLEGIYSTVVLKDVIGRNAIDDVETLRKLVLFLADNVGSPMSPNKIRNTLISDGHAPASVTRGKVARYASALESAFIFYAVSRYDTRGREHLRTLNKFYIADTGIRNLLLGYRDVDRGHILENIVYLELRRRGYAVSIGKVGTLEVDFIATTPFETHYFQVCETLRGDETRQRELNSLNLIADNHPKTVLTMDHDFVESEKGIKLQNIVEWLLE